MQKKQLSRKFLYPNQSYNFCIQTNPENFCIQTNHIQTNQMSPGGFPTGDTSGECGIRTHVPETDNRISSAARYDHFDNSPSIPLYSPQAFTELCYLL